MVQRSKKTLNFIPEVDNKKLHAALLKRINPISQIRIYRILEANAALIIDFLESGGTAKQIQAALADVHPPIGDADLGRFRNTLTVFRRVNGIKGWERSKNPKELPWWAKRRVPVVTNLHPSRTRVPTRHHASGSEGKVDDLFARLRNPSLAEINTAKVRQTPPLETN